jgi:hypothetical protein
VEAAMLLLVCANANRALKVTDATLKLIYALIKNGRVKAMVFAIGTAANVNAISLFLERDANTRSFA